VAGLSQGFSPAADEPPVAGCATLAAEYDWSDSELGPQDQWDPAVAAVVRTLIEATAPMAYLHGAGHAMVYNDRFADLLGARHPRAWAQQAALVMPEIWSRPGYAAAVDQVLEGGSSFHDDGEMLDLQARDDTHPDWAYLARSYSAVRDDHGSVLGVLVVVVEIAPVLVLVGGAEQGDRGAARWRGVELWDETVASQPLIWSGFRAGARSPEPAASKPDQRFVAEGLEQLILPINGPDIRGSIGYLGARRHLPDVQMLTLAARDREGKSTTSSSGEFYDVFGMPDGRLALTIGDVVGAGTTAAAVVAQVTVRLRGAALTSSDPNVMFAALDDLVNHLDRTWPTAEGDDESSQAQSAGFGGELFVTALLGVFDPATGDLTLASAGHPAPAVVHLGTSTDEAASGPGAEYVDVEPGPPLGIPGPRPQTQTVLLQGDALIGFTDGLLRTHGKGNGSGNNHGKDPGKDPGNDQGKGQDLAEGQATLLKTLSTMSATAARSISQHVVDTLIGDRGLEQDCALLVVVRNTQAHRMTSVLVPPHTIAVRGVRRWTSAQLESWGVSDDVVPNAVMCVSELVSNVVQHAGTSARVTMELADRLLVTVEDTGTWGAPRSGPENLSAVNGRGLALVAAVSVAMGHARGAEGSTVWFEMALNGKSP
jgi:serine phosphatase RsbU (regulator of sigma subunit)/anti-sigma regulatory factor (Ser/Thr protein kinase)